MEAMTTTMMNLPKDLAEEILSRAPLKSIKPVRLTCRNWNELSKSPSFMKLHLGRLSAAIKEGETQMIAMIGNNTYLASIDVNGDPSIEDKGTLNLLSETDKLSDIFHCEGLLLCILKGYSRFLVWNPYLGQKRWIEPPLSNRSFTYALGYEDNNSSVKLLRFTDSYHSKKSDNKKDWYDVYDFDSDSWTNLDATPTWRKAFWGIGVSLKGNTYWCATRSNSSVEVLADHIICFDFTSERFGPLLPLPFCAWTFDDYVALSCVRDEKLAVLLQHETCPYELDIWITTKIDPENVSWSKFLRMDIGPENDMMVPHIPEVMAPDIVRSFFIDEEKKVAMGFNGERPPKFVVIGEAAYVRELDLLGEPAHPKWTPHVCAYVPNLLQIKKPAEGERK
ncbi:unnamed protein product [Microthlaspi erraticum]|uniref:F-box domain-containing protein n=1 Tax=Microthlaspi erraticum TaxID=1685480 RepID=A0A6D2JYG8_9BRAS|nr:unnamed protein product [Microthlaspi erraticum]CAA7059176.1 unnamed protein product [Microthlaspi erraticum]